MKQSIGSDALKLTTSKIITMAISMISAMILSRFRTLEEYGTYSQLLLVVNIVITILMLGLPNSINFFLGRSESNEEKQKFLSVYYTVSTILSFLTGLILIFSTPIIVDYFDNPLIKKYIYVLAIFPWTKIILSSIENILIVYSKTIYLMRFRVLNSLALLLIIIIVEFFNLGFEIYMLFFISVESIFAVSVYLIVKNISGGINISIDKVLIIKILKFSLPIGLASVVGMLNVQLDKLLIGNFFSTEELAIYTNAAREMPLTIVSTSLIAVLMPKLVQMLKEKQIDKVIDLWGTSIFLSYSIICFFSISLFVFAPEVLTLLYSKKYLPGTQVFRVYNLVLLLRFTYFGMILNSTGKTRFIFYSSIASLILNVVLNYIFYTIFGFIGPAIATFISIITVQIFQLIATGFTINVSLKHIFPWKELSIITLINISMGVLFAFFKLFLPIELYLGEIIESIILGSIWGMIYIILMKNQLMQKWNDLNQLT